MGQLDGKVALVTGGSQGIGHAIAHGLAAEGARIVIADLRGAEAAAAAFPNGVGLTADVADEAGVETLVNDAIVQCGSIDILVNNAGVPAGMHMATFVDLEPTQWRDVVELNLFGSLLCIRAVLPAMRAAGWGRVIQISSGAAQAGLSIGVSLYGASKSGIEGFLRHLSQEVAREGITVNAIALGLMANAVPDLDDGGDVLAKISRSVPVGRLGRPDDAGAMVTFVASDEAEWLTGQTIQLNGGQTTT
jgi:NAD(P)-dependent dehydrogenase (short-subunit alcohol dehydrogenase family)